MVHPEDKPHLREHMERKEWETKKSIVLRFVHKDGSYVRLRCSTSVMLDGRHQVFCSSMQHEDELERTRRRHEQQLEEEHAVAKTRAHERRQLIENANAPIFGIDVDGNVNEWNRITE